MTEDQLKIITGQGTPENKPAPEKKDTTAFKIMAIAFSVYLIIMFWYIAVPVLILIGALLYWQYKKNPKFQEKVKGKMSGLKGKFWAFMKR